jgi:hypothetical protein
LDLFVASGAVLVIEQLVLAGDPYPIHLPNQLFRNLEGKGFVEVSQQAGSDVTRSEVSRGTAIGDVDNDGDMDILVSNNNGRMRLLENLVGNQQKWLGLRLIDPDSKRDLLGTRVALKRKGLPTLWRRVRTDGGYCSANDPRVLFGLGGGEEVDSVEILWVDGSREVWENPALMRYTTLRKGFVGRGEKP